MNPSFVLFFFDVIGVLGKHSRTQLQVYSSKVSLCFFLLCWKIKENKNEGFQETKGTLFLKKIKKDKKKRNFKEKGSSKSLLKKKCSTSITP